ncbi:hypothetical protein SAMN05660653_03252 [Desulfonatronum thiosulfatophilum]|uniref:Uncharacterized protein n=1 Tax=Desulfonatronum thiosulfatophilum TaxID=617002 RepID=A0A1G6EXC8_9BACT|nr:hypothetical protein SAMN05660653_03252 [Desulfonatronum thiosulfatophilum]
MGVGNGEQYFDGNGVERTLMIVNLVGRDLFEQVRVTVKHL